MHFRILPLEERIVLDAAAAIDVLNSYHLESIQKPAIDLSHGALAPDNNLAMDAVTHDTTGVHVLVVSSSVQDSQILANAAKDQSHVVGYDPATTTLTQLASKIAADLQGQQADSIAFVNEGTAAQFSLTQGISVSLNTLGSSPDLQAFWHSIGTMVKDGGRVDLLACNVAATSEGVALVSKIDALLDTTQRHIGVGASTDVTGNVSSGGNWTLELGGMVDAAVLYFNTQTLTDWSGTLAANNPPQGADNTITVDESVTLFDTAHTFTMTDFGFSDPNDNPANNPLSVRISAFAGGPGRLAYDGQFVEVSIAFSGFDVSAEDIADGKLAFVPIPNQNGNTSFLFQVQDDGGTDDGGVDTDPTARTMTIDVTPVNSAPSGINHLVNNIPEDTPYIFLVEDFGFSDANDSPPNNFQAVKITSLDETLGTLTNDGNAVTNGDFISVSDIIAEKLIFTPIEHASGVSFVFLSQVQDDGGGTTNIDLSPNGMVIHYLAVNDAPQGADNTITVDESVTLFDNAHTFTMTDFGFSDPNDNPANNPLSVRIFAFAGGPGRLLYNGQFVAVPIAFSGFDVSAADIANGELAFVPIPNQNGNTSFLFQVQDDGGTDNDGIDTDPTARTMTIGVTPVNSAPSGTNHLINNIPEDTPYIFLVEDFGFSDANDSPPNNFQAVKITSLDETLGTLTNDGNAVTNGDFISVSDIIAEKLIFTPIEHASGLSLIFTFQVQDDGGGTTNIDLSPNGMIIHYLPVNDAPQGTDNTITVDESQVSVPHLFDAARTLTIADFGFSDPNDNPANNLLSVRIFAFAGGPGRLAYDGQFVEASIAFSGFDVSAADIAAGKLAFVPITFQNGSTSFLFNVRDDGGTDIGGIDTDPTARTMTLNVTSVNNAPIGGSTVSATLEDTPYIFTVADFPFADPNDTPPNNFEAIKITNLLLQGLGTLTNNGALVAVGDFISVANINAGKFIFTPVEDANGGARFDYVVQDDGGGATDTDLTASLKAIIVTPVNDAPKANPDSYNTPQGTALTVAAPGVLANDTDVDSATITAIKVTNPGHGSVTLNPDGSFTYNPTAGYVGPDFFTYKANDTLLDSNVARVDITVNSTLVFIPGPNEIINANSGAQTIMHWATITGPAGEPLQILITVDNAALFTAQPSINVTSGDLTFTSINNASGTAQVTATLSEINDPTSSITKTFTIGVKPLAFADSYNNTNSSTPLVVTAANGVLTNDTQQISIDASHLTAQLLASPLNGSLTFDASDGSFTYTANPGFGGTDSFTYKAVAGALVSDVEATVTINVNASPTLNPGSSGAINYVENSLPVIVAPSATVTDPDAPNFKDGKLTVDLTGTPNLTDALVIVPSGSISLGFDFSVFRPSVKFNGVQIGTFIGGVFDVPLVITFNANATPAAVNAVIQRIGFADIGSVATYDRTITYKITDGKGGESNILTKTVNVISQVEIDAHNITIIHSSQPISIGALSGLHIDNTNPENISVTLSVSSGNLNFSNGAPLTGLTISGQGSNTMIISGPTDMVNLALVYLTYTQLQSHSGTDYLTISVQDENPDVGVLNDLEKIKITIL